MSSRDTRTDGHLDRTELRQPLRFEARGTDRIPEEERRSTPWTFFVIMTGSSFNLGSIVFGWLPISLGLGLSGALSAVAVGTLVGLIPITPLVLVGSKAATNNSTASGAHFGVRGRLIGSGLGLSLTVVSTAIAIWVDGAVLVAVVARLVHASVGNGALAASYVLLAALSIVIAVYGYHLLARATWVLMIGGVLVTVLMPVAFAGHIDLAYRGGHYALGSFGATWLLAALAAGTGSVMSQATQFGDWTRYIPTSRYPASRLLPPVLLAIAIGYIVPVAIGSLVTTSFANPNSSFPQSLVAGAPGWYAVVLVPAALFGGLGWSASSIYSSGLDLHAVAQRLTRAGATAIISAASVAVVLAGSLIWDASASMAAALVILLAVSAPWAAVVGVGYLRCQGRYLPDDLQVFNRRARGGAYWYTGGWNPPAVLAWAVGVVFGLTAVRTTLYAGPLAGIAGGVDVSFAGSFLIAALLYLILDAIRLRRPTSSPRAASLAEEDMT